MTGQEATEMFRQADDLFRQGFHLDALAILDDLDRAYPLTRHIMFPRALCLYRLGRAHEAWLLSKEIVERFDYHRAQALHDAIERQFAAEERPDAPETLITPAGIMPSDGDSPGFGATDLAQAPDPARRQPRFRVLMIMGGILAAAMMLVLGVLYTLNWLQTR